MQHTLNIIKIDCNNRLCNAINSLTEVAFCNMIEIEDILADFSNKRILFAISLDEFGYNEHLPLLLRKIRSKSINLKDSIAGIIIDSNSKLYTKSVACQIAFALCSAGCAMIGRPLVEATSDLKGFAIMAKNEDCSLLTAYTKATVTLAERLVSYSYKQSKNPNILVIHASNHSTSNTMALWGMVKEHLTGIEITEICLRNGTVDDCSGCAYTLCNHYGERNSCVYGGVIVTEVYPALEKADAIVMLCPNYNDSMSANLSAFINRLTAMYRQTPFTEKGFFGIVVSGYSGSDIVASQIISGLNMNKAFFMPANSIITATANNPNDIFKVDGILEKARELGSSIKKFIGVKD